MNAIRSSIALLLLSAAAFDAHAAEVTVEIKKFLFEPKEITVAPGDKVVFINRDETPHQIKADDGSFVSKALDTDDLHEQVFATAGDFSYVCTLHPYMSGIVHVKGTSE
jgi:plastocyanin